MKKSSMKVEVRRKSNSDHITTLEDIHSVQKNAKGDKWYIFKELTEDEMITLNTDKEVFVFEFPVSEYYLVMG